MDGMTDAGRIVRRARNEVLFREINERLHDLNGSFGTNEWLCECSDLDCVGRIELTDDEYEAVRRHGARFVLLAGHEQLDIERVVARHTGYVVAEKTGIGAELALLRDPRPRPMHSPGEALP
jgi:hypothetical protein